MKILVVDDQVENLIILEEILKLNGYEVIITKDGEKAIEIAQITKPDLIVLDIIMPNIDGYEVCKKLKSIDKSFKIIFLSSIKNEDDIVKAFEVGGEDYITKPIKKAEVISRINAHLATKKQFDSLNSLIKKSFHEIYTPLGIIESSCDILKFEYGENEYIDRATVALRMLDSVYKDIYYAIKKEQRKRQIIQINLLTFIKERVEAFELLAKTKGMSIDINEGKNLSILMDKEELERVVDNTLSNAIKYSKEKSKVSIDMFEKDSSVVLAITNEGKIKNPEAIFYENYQENSENVGLGFGLSIVKEICQENSIKIEVKSDKNSTFFYYFKGE